MRFPISFGNAWCFGSSFGLSVFNKGREEKCFTSLVTLNHGEFQRIAQCMVPTTGEAEAGGSLESRTQGSLGNTIGGVYLLWKGIGEKGTLIHCWWGSKLVQPLWKAVWRFLRKLGMDPPFDPAIPLLGLYPKDLKSAYYRDIATSMFIATQLTIARLCNQQRCPSIDE